MRTVLLFSGTKWVLSIHLHSNHVTFIFWLTESHLLQALVRVTRAKFIRTKKKICLLGGVNLAATSMVH